ncbi:MAG: hypothetical protein ACMG6E_03645 [Candidatus Roizmanbacteria bacterium]
MKEIETYSENQKVLIHISTLNCAGKQPSNFKELIPIFKPIIQDSYPYKHTIPLIKCFIET